jgi:hypothetical protein
MAAIQLSGHSPYGRTSRARVALSGSVNWDPRRFPRKRRVVHGTDIQNRAAFRDTLALAAGWRGMAARDKWPEPDHRPAGEHPWRRLPTSRPARSRQVRRPTTSPAGVPQPCLKHRSNPVISGQQGSVALRHDRGTDALLSWTNGHMNWSMRGAGDRDRTGMASLEGWGPQAPNRLIRPPSGGCRAFHVPSWSGVHQGRDRPEFRTHPGDQRAWPSRVALAQQRRAGPVRASRRQGAGSSVAVLRDCPGVSCSASSLPRSPACLPLTPVIKTQPAWAGRSDPKRAGGRHRWRLAASPLPLAVLAGWLVAGAVLARLVFRWAPRR